MQPLEDLAGLVEDVTSAIALFEIGFVLFDGDDNMPTCNPVFAQVHDGSGMKVEPGNRFIDLQRACLQRGLIHSGILSQEAWLERRLAQGARADQPRRTARTVTSS